MMYFFLGGGGGRGTLFLISKLPSVFEFMDMWVNFVYYHRFVHCALEKGIKVWRCKQFYNELKSQYHKKVKGVEAPSLKSDISK